MQEFLKNIALFLLSVVVLLSVVYLLKNGTSLVDVERPKDRIFYEKKERFSNFITDKESVNLVLGSSIIEEAVIPDSLGKNWFSFANRIQNIYESFIFIDYYKDSIIIDTILIGIQPFDFPYSYVQNREKSLPHLNGSFHIFDQDSITNLTNTWRRNYQIVKDETYIRIPKLLTYLKTIYKGTEVGISKNKREVWTDQGYSARLHKKPVNLDTLYSHDHTKITACADYFHNVRRPANFSYFELFDSLASSLEIKVVYLISPKSVYYHKGTERLGHNGIWSHIVDGLNSKPVQLWDYERLNTGDYKFDFYWDATHVSPEGAQAFTNTIRKRLKDMPK